MGYRIDDLARAANTTVRNIRAYQERGLIPPPRREGRVGLYSDGHLARLRLVTSLLDRGYSLANIQELVAAMERGQPLAELLGAVTDPWSDESPVFVDAADLAERFGTGTGEHLRAAVELGLFEPQPDGRFRVPSARLLEVGTELVAAGLAVDEVIGVLARMQQQLDEVAADLVDLVATNLIEPRMDRLPEVAEDLADLVRRLRPMAATAVGAVLATTLERRVRERLGTVMRAVAEHAPENVR